MKAQKNALLPTQRNITSANLEREEGVKNGLAPNKLHIQDQVWQQLDQDCVVVHIAPGSLARHVLWTRLTEDLRQQAVLSLATSYDIFNALSMSYILLRIFALASRACGAGRMRAACRLLLAPSGLCA